MQTNFFSKIAEYAEAGVLTISLQVKDGKMSVSALLTPTSEDRALKRIKPFVVTQRPEVLDAKFFEAIERPIGSVKTLSEKVSAYEAEVKEAEKATQMKKKEQEERKKTEEKVKNLIGEADKQLEEKAYEQALATAEKALQLNAESKTAKEAYARIKTEVEQSKQPSLF
jgi:PRTRC genetic system protein E